MSQLLAGKTAVVTGSANGNGRAIALMFADHGADIVVADLQAEPKRDGTPTHKEIQQETNSDALFVECDIRNKDELTEAIDTADAFDGLDIMVNNAGIFEHKEFLETEKDELSRIMDVNVKGVFFGSQIAAKRMQEKNIGGNIINMSSLNSTIGIGSAVAYCASKGAVHAMTPAMADALGPEIRVNSIHPGPIRTAMYDGNELTHEEIKSYPAERIGEPEDVAGAALYLASDLSGFVTGHALKVDGGLSTSHHFE